MEHIQTEQHLPGGRWRRWNRKGWSAFASMHRSVTIGVLAVGMSILQLGVRTATAQNADTTAVLRTLRIEEVGISGSQTSPDAERAVAHPAFRPEKPLCRARPDSGIGTAALSFGRYPRTRSERCAGRHLRQRRLIRPNHGIAQRDRLHGCAHGTPVAFASGRSRLHFGRRSDRRRTGSRRLCRRGQYPHGAAAAALPPLRRKRRTVRLRLRQPLGRRYRRRHDALRGGFLPPQRRLPPQHRFRHLQRLCAGGTFQTRRAGLFDFQAGYQNRAFGSNGFYAA